ncbi:hypothetical protein MVEN_02023200 [Mycena venus]|uniref:Uncharacterized protein n=1 Tax=Mycena venus TaxID=2733690 RepID=A0A8H7CJU5_9AGAR|nr:hypothetical protein MVEN_02023200 [Mycena venus]
MLSLPFGRKYKQEFLIFGVPEEKYGHHTAFVWHEPKKTYRKVVATFGRMEKEIADADFLGQIRMMTTSSWDKLEKEANSLSSDWTMTAKRAGGKRLFAGLRERMEEGVKEEGAALVAVYLVKVKTTREHLLFDGKKASLPSGYLTYYMAK